MTNLRRFPRLSSLAIVALAIVAIGSPAALADLAPLNGGGGLPADDPPITVGAGWWTTTDAPPAFFWDSHNWNVEGPFTFSWPTPVQLYVTDAFVKGDRFEVYDNDILIGTTPTVDTAPPTTDDPDTAFADPTYSSGPSNRRSPSPAPSPSSASASWPSRGSAAESPDIHTPHCTRIETQEADPCCHSSTSRCRKATCGQPRNYAATLSLAAVASRRAKSC